MHASYLERYAHEEVVDWMRQISADLKRLPLLGSRKIYLLRRWLATLKTTAENDPFFKEIVINGKSGDSLDLADFKIPQEKLDMNRRLMVHHIQEVFWDKTVGEFDRRFEATLPTTRYTPHEVYLWLVKANELHLREMFTEFFKLFRKQVFGPFGIEFKIEKKLRLFSDLWTFINQNYESYVWIHRLKFKNEALIRRFDKLIAEEYKKKLDGKELLETDELIDEIRSWKEYKQELRIHSKKRDQLKQAKNKERS